MLECNSHYVSRSGLLDSRQMNAGMTDEKPAGMTGEKPEGMTGKKIGIDGQLRSCHEVICVQYSMNAEAPEQFNSVIPEH